LNFLQKYSKKGGEEEREAAASRGFRKKVGH
jgi:hypothetical protein